MLHLTCIFQFYTICSTQYSLIVPKSIVVSTLFSLWHTGTEDIFSFIKEQTKYQNRSDKIKQAFFYIKKIILTLCFLCGSTEHGQWPDSGKYLDFKKPGLSTAAVVPLVTSLPQLTISQNPFSTLHSPLHKTLPDISSVNSTLLQQSNYLIHLSHRMSHFSISSF